MIREMTGRRAQLAASLLLLVIWSTPASAITGRQTERVARQSGLLAQHCVLRSGCMREGDNMLASLVTEFPFHPPGVPSNSQAGTISLLNPLANFRHALFELSWRLVVISCIQYLVTVQLRPPPEIWAPSAAVPPRSPLYH